MNFSPGTANSMRPGLEAYSRVKFRTGSMPASTGICGPKSGWKRAGGRRLGVATAPPIRARNGSPLAPAMSRARLRQFLQPGHGDFVASWTASVDFRHGQHFSRRQDAVVGGPPPANRSHHGSGRSHIGVARLWLFGHHPRHGLFQKSRPAFRYFRTGAPPAICVRCRPWRPNAASAATTFSLNWKPTPGNQRPPCKAVLRPRGEYPFRAHPRISRLSLMSNPSCFRTGGRACVQKVRGGPGGKRRRFFVRRFF